MKAESFCLEKASMEGFEPPTLWTGTKCAIHCATCPLLCLLETQTWYQLIVSQD